MQKRVPVEDIIDDRFLAAALRELSAGGLSLDGYWTPQAEQKVAAR